MKKENFVTRENLRWRYLLLMALGGVKKLSYLYLSD
jgi:hypothetical protein